MGTIKNSLYFSMASVNPNYIMVFREVLLGVFEVGMVVKVSVETLVARYSSYHRLKYSFV